MGNTTRRDSDLLIYVETEKMFYNSGSSIEGIILVEAKKNFNFDALYLRIDGEQHCQWFEGSSKNRRKYVGSENFYCIEHLIQKFPDSCLQVGRYGFPFSIELSENVPGSFADPSYDAQIEYKIKAYFVNFNDPRTLQLEEIPLIIREPFRQENQPIQGQVEKAPVLYGCCEQGVIGLGVWFESGQITQKKSIQVTIQLLNLFNPFKHFNISIHSTLTYLENVCYEGENVKMEISADNISGSSMIDTFTVELVQYTFVSANNGVCRTYRKGIEKKKLDDVIPIGEKRTFGCDFKVPLIEHQTAISTLVANYFRLQVSTRARLISSNNPCIYSPLFILKRTFNLKPQKIPRNMTLETDLYRMNKIKIFRAPEYWFRKNRNLSVVNFRFTDLDNNQLGEE